MSGGDIMNDKFEIKAIRTKLSTRGEQYDESWEVTIRCTIKLFTDEESEYLAGEHWLKIVGGITGYESMQFTKENMVGPSNRPIHWTACDNGWNACGGTRGSWDRLYLPAKTMIEIWKHFKHLLEVKE